MIASALKSFNKRKKAKVELRAEELASELELARGLMRYINLDLPFYRGNNEDLKGFSDNALIRHYAKHGYFEGRHSSEIASRAKLIELVGNRKTLEIGPFCYPVTKGDNVSYLDAYSTEKLVKLAKSYGLPPETVPTINYLVKDGSISDITDKFEVIISSHNIEHQPNIIKHLNEAYELLEDGGQYFMMVPHANYCFDANLPTSKISELFNAFYEDRKVHSIGSLIEQSAMVTHNDAPRHWTEPKNQDFIPLETSKVSEAIKNYEEAKARGEYIDAHAWQFTPFSFSNIMNCLIDLSVIKFKTVLVNGPVFGSNEFTAIFTK